MLIRLQANAWISADDLDGAFTELRKHFQALEEGEEFSAIHSGHISLKEEKEE